MRYRQARNKTIPPESNLYTYDCIFDQNWSEPSDGDNETYVNEIQNKRRASAPQLDVGMHRSCTLYVKMKH